MPKGVYDHRNVEHHKATRKQLMVVRGKRNEIDMDKDTWYAVKRIANGATYQQVADELNERNPEYSLSREAVRNDVERAMVEWKKENMANIDAYIARDLMRIEEIERKVMEEFELSKHSLRPNEYASLMKRGLTPDEIDDMYRDRPMAGDPRYLDTLLRLQHQRMHLLGIDKGNDVAQQTIVNYQFNGIGDDALEKMADMLQDNKYRELADEQ